MSADDLTAQTEVECRDVPGFPGYRVGIDGSLWSNRRRGRLWGKSPTTDTYHRVGGSVEHTKFNVEYLAYFLIRDGKQFTKRAHKLVAEAFLGPCPDGMECRHKDGNGLNNNLENIHYGTRAENVADRDTHGTSIRGDRHPHIKVTDAQVEEIRQLAADGVSTEMIAGRFGISKSHVHAIVKRIWRRLPA